MDIKMEEVEGKEQANYPFVLSAGLGKQVSFKIMFDYRRYNEFFINQVGEQLIYILTQISENPDADISAIQFVTEQEKQKLIFDWNDTDSEYPREATIHEMLEEQALKRPEAIALESEHETITYEELNKYANQIALYLLDSEVEIGSSIGICMDRSVDEIASMLGVLKAGGAYVGLDPEYPEERLRY